MITRRLALATLGLAATGLAAPVFAGHDKKSPSGGDEMVLGDPDAPITIIEYSSLTCPHCANFHNNILPRLKENYIDTGKARLIYRDFPFDRPGQMAAALARCAGPNRFFGFLEVLFRSQKTWAGAANPAEALRRIGRLGGLKREHIDACLADKELLDSILRSRIDGAKKFDISSTPTFIVNGEKVVGSQPYERFEEILDRILLQS